MIQHSFKQTVLNSIGVMAFYIDYMDQPLNDQTVIPYGTIVVLAITNPNLKLSFGNTKTGIPIPIAKTEKRYFSIVNYKAQ